MTVDFNASQGILPPKWLEPLRLATFRHLGLLLSGIRLDDLHFDTGYLPTNYRVPAIVVSFRHKTLGKIAHFNYDWTKADVEQSGIPEFGRILAESLAS